MLCPQCGYDMGSRNKCLRCGYESKILVTVDEEAQKKQQEPETKVIDPDRVYLTDEYGNDVDGGFVDPFDALFGSLFNPIGDLLGGLFGVNMHTPHFTHTSHIFGDGQPQPETKKRKTGEVVEVSNVEIYDENGEPVDKPKKPEPGRKTKPEYDAKHDGNHRPPHTDEHKNRHGNIHGNRHGKRGHRGNS